MTTDAKPSDKRSLARQLHDLFEALSGEPFYVPFRIRLGDLRSNVRDEVEQFRLLQTAVLNNPLLDEGLTALGFSGVATMDSRRVSRETGALVQAFNHMIEQHWRHDRTWQRAHR